MTAMTVTKEQRWLAAAIDIAVADSALSGYIIDPIKIDRWKGYIADGMSAPTLIKIIGADKDKGAYIVSKLKEFPSYPGMKSMGNGYYISGDDEEDPPVK